MNRVSEIAAATWFLAAVGGTLIFGTQLGLRGWCWLGAHHVLCVVGVSWEARQAWRRHQLRVAASPGRRITP